MSITIREKGKNRWTKGKASCVISVPPPIARGGLRPNAKKKKPGNGNGKKKRKTPKARTYHKQKGMSLAGLNAFSPQTIGLPRSVGDYTYVTTIENTTVNIDGHRRVHCFTPFITFKGVPASLEPGATLFHTGSNSAQFTPAYGWTSMGSAVSGDPKSRIELFESAAVNNILGGSVELVPASMTVRVTCPTALLKATGQVFMGRWNINCDPRQFNSYQEIVDGFMSFGQPRPITAPQIATEGVRVNTMPRNMNAYCDFLEAEQDTLTGDRKTVQPYPMTALTGPWDGFAPIFLVTEPVAQAESHTELNIQVAIKWRYRFAMTNPAAKTHTHQSIVSDNRWNDICRVASAAGHGVEKLVNVYERARAAELM